MVCGDRRLKGRLDEPFLGLAAPSIEAVAELAGEEPVVLWGGEPTLRADLPALLAALPKPWLRSDGLAFGRAAGSLAGLLGGVIVVLPSGRRDASDWLLGRTGATKAVVAGIRGARDAGLPIAIEVPLTRPTAPHLGETVELAAHLGASAIRLRRLSAAGLDPDDFVALSPRVAPLEAPLEEAARIAGRRDIELVCEGLPACARGSVEALVPSWLNAEVPSDAGRCGSCPGPASCEGVPADYSARFGWEEFPPPERPAGRVEVSWTPDEPTRLIRARLAAATRHGLPIRVLAQPSLGHGDAADLLRECTRLSAVDLELVGDLNGLEQLGDDELGRLRRFDRVVTDSPSPVLERLHRCTRGRVELVLELDGAAPALPYPVQVRSPGARNPAGSRSPD